MSGYIRKALICIAVMAVVAFAGWFGRKAYRQVTVRQLTTEASHYLQKKDLHNAGLCLQRAIAINPLNVEANELTADLLEEEQFRRD